MKSILLIALISVALTSPVAAQTVEVAKGQKSIACQKEETVELLTYLLETNDLSSYYTAAPQEFRSGECVAFPKGQQMDVLESDSRGLVKVRIKGDPHEYWTDPSISK